jgi:hypothetical protein
MSIDRLAKEVAAIANDFDEIIDRFGRIDAAVEQLRRLALPPPPAPGAGSLLPSPRAATEAPP